MGHWFRFTSARLWYRQILHGIDDKFTVDGAWCSIDAIPDGHASVLLRFGGKNGNWPVLALGGVVLRWQMRFSGERRVKVLYFSAFFLRTCH